MAHNNVYKALEGEIKVATAKAILFVPIDKQTGVAGKQEWFPKSQILSHGGTYDEIEGTFQFILASEWILGQKGLLSKAIDKSLVKADTRVVGTNPAHAAPYGLNQSAKEVANRLPYKNDEGPDYWAGYDNLDQHENGDQ